MAPQAPPTKAKAEASISVSEPMRDELRVECAKEGITYDRYLRQELSLLNE